MIDFYKNILEIPMIKTDDDNTNGVYLGFMANAPTLCIWDCKKCAVQPTGHQSLLDEGRPETTLLEHVAEYAI